jgi:hypothetical protein
MSLLGHADRELKQALDKKGLNEKDGHNDKNRREVEPTKKQGQPPPDRIEDRFRCRMEKPDKGVVRIRIDP